MTHTLLKDVVMDGHWKVWIYYQDTYTCVGITTTNQLAHLMAKRMVEDQPDWQPVVTRCCVTDMQTVQS